MNKKLIQTKTLNMSRQEWLNFRLNGIGGSEVGIILGLNPYSSAIKLFYDKVEMNTDDIENEKMFWGKIHEDSIASVWQYYEPGQHIDTLINNFNENKIIRKCKKVNRYIQNPSFPHLFASLDRIIVSNNGLGEGVLEIKTISDFASKVWESEIPPFYLVQLQTYLLITEMNYGELAILKNGRTFEVYHFEKNQEIIEGIKIKTLDFWNRIVEARKLKLEGKSFEHLEPEPDNSEAYEKFMKEKYLAKPIKIDGTPELLSIAREIQRGKVDVKRLEESIQASKNKIISAMREAEILDFFAMGQITYKANAKGVRIFNLNLKEKEY